MKDERQHCAEAAAAIYEDVGNFRSETAFRRFLATLIEAERASARADERRQVVAECIAMAEVHKAQADIRRQEANTRSGVYAELDIEKACVRVAEDIIHDLRTLEVEE